jgi:hypothetical protein
VGVPIRTEVVNSALTQRATSLAPETLSYNFFLCSTPTKYIMIQFLFHRERSVYLARDSAVGIAAGYGLDGLGIEFWWEAIFSAPFQTGPGSNPASYTMDTGSFSREQSGSGVVLTIHTI